MPAIVKAYHRTGECSVIVSTPSVSANIKRALRCVKGGIGYHCI